MSDTKRFVCAFMVNPQPEPDRLAGVDRPTDEELHQWHAENRLANLPVCHEHDKANVVGTVVRSYSDTYNGRTRHNAVMKLTDPDIANRVSKGEIRHVSLQHATWTTTAGTGVKRSPLHIATTNDPVRPCTTIRETSASVLANTGAAAVDYVQSAVVSGESIQTLSEFVNPEPTVTVMSAPPITQQNPLAGTAVPPGQGQQGVQQQQHASLATDALAGVAMAEMQRHAKAAIEAEFRAQQDALKQQHLQLQQQQMQQQQNPMFTFMTEQLVRAQLEAKQAQERAAALEAAAKQAQEQAAAQAAQAAQAQTKAPAKSAVPSKEEPEGDDDDAMTGPKEPKVGSKRRDRVPDPVEDEIVQFHAKARKDISEEQLQRLVRIARGQENSTEEDEQALVKVLEQWVQAQGLAYGKLQQRYTEAARQVLGEGASEEDVVTQAKFYSENPRLCPPASGGACRSGFGSFGREPQGMRTEWSASVGAAKARAGGKGGEKALPPKTSANTMRRGMFSQGGIL